MNMEKSEVLEISSRLFTAYENGDPETVAACYAPETRVWHNFSNVEVSGEEHIAALKAILFTEFTERKYVDVRVEMFEHGFFRQHSLTGFWRGVPLNMPICAICRVSQGRVIRLEEYMQLPFPA